VKNLVLYLCGALLLAFGCTHANAQQCTPSDGLDGPIDTVHSAVKKPGDPVTLTWTDPEFTIDCEPLTGDLALTGIQVYISINAPVVAGLSPTTTVAPGVGTLEVTADANRGERIYYATRACNSTECSALSRQRFVKLPGPPKAARDSGVN
jgi:hypothetical protein